ncbi:MAG: hypothetical protein Q4G33_04765 [bacterium]|nr:hypothetical protein [bacterium]
MADVRLASYADLQNEIQQRENADEEISNKIETLSETSAQAIAEAQNSANAARSSADTAQSSADNALLRANEALSSANNAASAITETNSHLSSVNKNSPKRMVVQELPSKSVFHDFTDGVSKFTNSYRTACSVTEDEGEFYQSITGSGNSNTYRRAYFDCSDIMNGATLIVA